MIALYIILGVIVLVALYIVMTYNSLIRQRNKCGEAFSTMDVYLKKRSDLIPNVVATVKGYAAHEASVLEKVTSQRTANPVQRFEKEAQISGALRNIFAVAENYPALKAGENFAELQRQLKAVEEDIANARRYYNGSVRQYNDTCMMIPSSVIASMFHFEPQAMYAVEPEERANVKVEF